MSQSYVSYISLIALAPSLLTLVIKGIATYKSKHSKYRNEAASKFPASKVKVSGCDVRGNVFMHEVSEADPEDLLKLFELLHKEGAEKKRHE